MTLEVRETYIYLIEYNMFVLYFPYKNKLIFSFFRMSGRNWKKQMLVSAFFIPSIVCGTAFTINFVAIYYHASRAIPFGTMVAVSCICIFVILPLTLELENESY